MKAKIMKSKITNKLCSFFGNPKMSLSAKPKVSLSGLTRQSFLLILLLILASCSNLLTKDLEQTSDGNTYLVIRPDSISIDARTIQAKEEYALANLTSITLDATKSDSTKENFSIGSISELYEKQFLLKNGAGTYTFELKGQLDGVYFYQKREGIEIEESKANTISFTLSPVKGSSDFSEFEGFGGLSVEMNFSTTNVSGINITLKDMSNRLIDQKTITSLNSGKVTYNRLAKNTSGTEARIPVGTYRLNIEFYTKDTTLGSNVIINSYPYLVKIEKGQNAYLKENFDLTSVHTISYNNISGASPAPGQRMRTKFTSKDEFMLPRMQKDGYAFMGWYKNSDFSGDVCERIESDTSENQRFYAKFMSSTIYVDADGDDTKDGSSSTKALKTLSKAVEKITEANDSNREWYIYMSGEFTEPQTIAGNFNSENNYRETIPAKAINILGNNAILHNTDTATALRIMTETPVTLRDIEIDGNYTGNKGIAMGYDEQTHENINSNVTLGSGVHIHDNFACDVYVRSGMVNLYGSVEIEDYIQVTSDAEIVLLDDLSSDASITIMLEDYREPYIWETEVNKTQLVSFDKNIINFASNKDYFHVKPDGSGDWFIDEEGCLNKKCTISFTGEGATSMSDVSVGMYTPISPDDSQFQIPARSGYEFAGWYYLYDEQRYTGSEYVHVRYIMNPFEYKDNADDSEFTHIESDMTLYAAWRKLGLSDIYVNANTGADGVYVEIDDEDTIYFGDGTEEHPLRTLNSAFDLIKEINDATEDYTITISGFTNEHDLPINSELPVNSLTLQGSSSAETDGIKASNISESVLPVSTTKSVTIRNMLINLSNVSYAVEGAVMNIGNGSTVTLEEGTIFEGPSSSIDSKGAVAIENGGTLIMQNDVTFQKFDIKCGAVNVKTGGTFTMNGGTFTNNESNGTCGAVYVNGGTFTMKDGYIKDNWQDAYQRANALPQGAGVCVASGTFIMEGGHITGNKSCVADGHDNMTTAGGGVFVYADGEFIMRGGEISDNHAYNQKISVAGKIYEEIDTTAHSYGGGVCLQASGNKLASFTMTGGTISGNTAGTSGNGIGFLGSLDDGVTGTITLGKNALITPDNDVYLPSFVTITVGHAVTGDDDNPIKATITPQEYRENQPILKAAENVNLDTEYDYFSITPQGTTTWTINEEGKLVSSSTGNNFYVGTNGDDENSGLDAEHPLKTIMAAIGKMNDSNADYVINVMGNLFQANFSEEYKLELTEDINGKAKSITFKGNADSGTYDIDGQSGGDPTTVMKVTTSVPIIIEGIKVTGGRADDSHLGGAIYIGEESTVILGQDTIVNGGGDHGCGSAIYVAASENGGVTKAGTLIMKDNAVVNADDYGEVYLCTGATIKVASALTGQSSFYDSNISQNVTSPIVAKITPQVYAENTPVIELAADAPATLNISDVYEKFAVFEEDTTSWLITNEGKLTKASSGGNGGNGNLSINLVTVPGNGSDIQNLLVGKNLITQTEYEHFMKYHGDVVSGSTYKPSETEDAKNTTPAYYITFVDAVIFCNLLSVENNLEPVYKIGERENLPGCVADISEWIQDTSLGISKVGDKYCFAWDRTKPYNDNPYWQWDSIYDGGKLYTDESANGYRLATLDEIVHIANWNISNGLELQSSSGINEWCDAYSQNNCDTGIFTANIADSSEEYFENCVTYHKHNAHEAPGDIIIGGEEVYCCGGGENFTRNLGFRVVRNAE